MMITMGCMRMVLTWVMFMGMLGLASLGRALSVPLAGFTSETETNAAAAKDAAPKAAEYKNPEYLLFRPGAEVLRVQQAILMYDAENYELASDIFLEEAESGNLLPRTFTFSTKKRTRVNEKNTLMTVCTFPRLPPYNLSIEPAE